ncbi:hypothetical protein GCG54_00009630 [Colletotrichum gloeosporioides]|uniref:F-box domain-containing protein n=1 Tax=Colletotrichum gloeosporioides TaxID=474922 RepID=A0A8H4C6L2_COLGL|nr:uncharacterized protein GCG54_00009630 [Colletotrichum gloeosporioides]KAF3798354.1 hypothetical protein GCG54_00009630 [Colletotrichum gloeosporioides]
MFDPNDAGVEDAQIEAKSSTNLLGDLPHELITGILSAADDATTISRLARTCRGLARIANCALYRTSFGGTDPMKWAVERDRSDTLTQILALRSTPKWAITPQDRGAHLVEALRAGSFRTADALLNAGAEIIYSASSRPELRSEEVSIRANESHGHLGSLALAARSRYHLTFWYKPTQPYASEAEYWRWKKRTMMKILARMRVDVSRRHMEYPILSFDGYRRELDIALIEAANADAHSIEMMDFLLATGANMNAEMNDQYVGQVWRNALDEEVPSLFRAKVEFLMERGINTNRVWSWQRPLTPAEFFLKKLHWSCLFSTDTSFIGRGLWMMEFLEGCGCLEWPLATFEAFNTCEIAPQASESVGREMGAGRELELILNDTEESSKPLQTALEQHLSRKLLERRLVTPRTEGEGPRIIDGHASKPDFVDKEGLPEAILRLADLREEWLAEGCSEM